MKIIIRGELKMGKKLIIATLITVLSILLVACMFKISSLTGQTGNKAKIPGVNKATSEQSKDSSNAVVIKILEEKDFTVTDGKDSISLDTSYKNFKIDKEEKKLDNNYVGEYVSGEYTYKNFVHEYEDFSIYVSNINYNFKNRNFDEYYITQITLKNSNFKTFRGIAIGSNIEDIQKLYGNGEKSIVDGITFLNYRLNDKELSFILDKEQKKVEGIILSIVTENIKKN